MKRVPTPLSAAVVAVGLALVLAGCTIPGLSKSTDSGRAAPSPSAHVPSPSATRSPVREHYPTGPPFQLESIAPLDGSTVGVAMPISIVFPHPVADSARARIERAITLTTSRPVTGAWHWFDPRRVDFRLKGFWQPGTQVTAVVHLDHVGDGYGRYGRQDYTTHFTIGTDVRTHVYVNRHETVVTSGGQVLRTMPSDAGSPQLPSWDGTMAVVQKLPSVRMTSCSAGFTCDKHNPNYYDVTLPWDVRLTWSGMFIHYSTGDPYPGHSYGSHGCVHLSYADAEWYYNLSKPGDPVVVTGSPRGDASGDNGYAGYNLTWPQWLAGSATGAHTTSA